MDIDLKAHMKVKVIKEAILLRHTIEFEVSRPTQAWQWMNQTRCVPDDNDWVRTEVSDAWRRCLEEYKLPLGNFSNWDNYRIANSGASDPMAEEIADLVKELRHNFHIFLKEAGIMLMLTAADGRVLYVLGEQYFPGAFMERMHQENAIWRESVIGNNGIGTTLELKKPTAFQGMEHYLSALHPFTTVGYPLLDESGQLLAVIGLLSDHQESMSSLLAFLHLICVLVNTDFPLAKNPQAHALVLEKIPFKAAPKLPESLNYSITPQGLDTLVNKAVKLQQYKVPILITGESGVGKDHFVTLIKNAGPRKNAPLVAINCASIPHDLIESELFGYESGSFTGARNTGKPGKFMLANTGILFLDEIGDMSFDLQSTLLRVLETSEFTPVGGSHPVHVDVQIVAATNVKLLEAVEAGRFRRDLYYRLNGAQIHLKPLRERADKNAIIHYILQRELNAIPAEEAFEISPEVISLIEQHPWPGNIRQLINVIRATLYTASSRLITAQDLPVDFIGELRNEKILNGSCPEAPADHENLPVMSLSDWELYAIKTTLKGCDGNISLAAKKLGIARATLYKKIERFSLNKTGDSGFCYASFESK